MFRLLIVLSLLFSFVSFPVSARQLALNTQALSDDMLYNYHGIQLCELSGWGKLLIPGLQSVDKVGEYKVGDKIIYGYRFGKLKGEFGKVYLFGHVSNGCFVKVISFGSYEGTNAYHQQSGNARAGERLYHLDLYGPGTHSTLGFLTRKISYEEMWNIVQQRFD